jgi:hypothetical protein
MRSAAAFFAVASLLLSGTASAQGNFQSAPIGGRSALMGGTGVALARDGSAPFLNPATIIHIDDSGVAFSVNFYTLQFTTLFGFHQPGAVDSRYGQISLPNNTLASSRADALPSTLCLFLTVGNWGDNKAVGDQTPSHRKGRSKLAACLGSLDKTDFDATAVGYSGISGKVSANQATNIQRFWNRIYVGPTYSYYISDRVALGASLHGIATTTSATWSVDTITQGANPATASAFDTGMSAYSIDLGGILGLVWHIDDVQVFGASVSTPTMHLVGNYNGTTALQTQGTSSTALVTTVAGGFSAPVPVRMSVGMGVETSRVRAESDVSAYVPITHLAMAEVTTQTTSVNGLTPSGASSTTLLMDGRPVVDAALGVEYFLKPSFSVLAGTKLDFTGLQPLQQEIGALAQTRMHQVAASLGIGSYGDGSELLLGTQVSYGWGQSLAFDPFLDPASARYNPISLVNAHSYGVMFVIAGGASISAFRRTLQDLGRAVKFPQPQ